MRDHQHGRPGLHERRGPARAGETAGARAGILLLGAGWLLGLSISGAGCADRTYLTKTHGRAYSEAFGRQTVNHAPPPVRTGRADPIQGLDSQEASVIARSYRQSLAGKEGAGDNAAQPNVIMTSVPGQPGSYMPPPSIPGGQ